jgi:D-glycero-alpha-D-manno-heptose-7-phosphate kinase
VYAHAQAPVRIGIAGGGTDLPAWTKDRVGHCLNLAIATYTHAVAIARPDRQVVASYRHRDEAACATEIANGLIRESALLHGFEDSFEVHTLSEVTSLGSGLGVSSSIAVSLAAAFSRLAHLRAGRDVEPKWMDGGEPAFRAAVAEDAWRVEIDRLRRPIGRQDHAAAAWGGLRLYAFEGDKARVERTFSREDAAWVAARIALVKLPEGHDSRAILSSARRADHLQLAHDAVAIAVEAIENHNAELLGRAIGLGQRSKCAIPGAVPAWLGALIARVEACPGVLGVKVAGAGGGGHLVVACEDEGAEEVRRATEMPVLRVLPDHEGVRSEGWL